MACTAVRKEPKREHLAGTVSVHKDEAGMILGLCEIEKDQGTAILHEKTKEKKNYLKGGVWVGLLLV